MNHLAIGSSRRALIAITSFTALSLVVRFWDYGQVGLQHFDEGVYGLAGFWTTQPRGLAGLDPDVLSYAPPGYLLLTGISLLLLGFTDQVVVLVSTLAGVASVPLAAAVGWCAFGPAVAVAAAALAALSGPHVVFSRMALTDVLFLFGWLTATLAGTRFLQKPGVGRAILMGLAIGLAQNLKYNGGLVGFALFLAALPGLPRQPRPLARLAGLWLLAAIVALLVYMPWYRFVENHGGYDRLLAHHRNYVDGFGAWPTNLRLQLAQATALSGGWKWLLPAWYLAGLAALWTATPSLARSPRHLFLIVAVLAASGLALVALPGLPWWLGLFLLPVLGFSREPSQRMVAAWWLIMAVLVPLYHPYSRLALPLHAAGWILCAMALVRLVAAAELVPPRFALSKGWVAWGLLVIGIAIGTHYLERRPRPLPALLLPTSGLRDGLRSHVTAPPPDPSGVLRMLARPPATFYLGIWNVTPFAFYDSLSFMVEVSSPADRLMIDEIQLRQESDAEGALARLLDTWEVVPGGSWTERLGPGTLLDLDPQAAFGDNTSSEVRWWLLRKRSSVTPLPSPSGPREESQ